MRSPLTHLQERLSSMDLSYLLSCKSDEPNVNAFNVGRALDRIGKSDYSRSYETMALTALHKYNIPTERIHADTTTISFYGEYDVSAMKLTSEEEQELLRIEQGYNKDGRPQSRQVLVGQLVTETGIPIVNSTMDGSTSDVEWNKHALDYFESLKKHGFQEGIYVADSKLVTSALVTRMNSASQRVSFVSRCPGNFSNKLEEKMIERAYSANTWEHLGQLGSGKKSSSYRGISFTEHICGGHMRLLVLESSSLASKATQLLEKEEAKLAPLIKDLEKKEFACIADAEKEYNRFKKMKQLQLFECTKVIDKHIQEKWPRGRRSASSRPTVTETYRIRIQQVTHNEEACRKFISNKSCFVLISNVTDETITDSQLLGIYKGQHVVENSFRHLKEPNVASVIYLKNPKRVEALMMLLTFALLIRAIIQHRMRDGLKQHQSESEEIIFAGWAGKPLERPTFKLLYEHSINCYFEREKFCEYKFEWPDVKTKELVVPLLKLMGLTVAELLQ
jgi:transposase